MKHAVTFIVLQVAAVLLAGGQSDDQAMQAEIERIDGFAADPETKLLVADAMAERLQTHRNRLLLLRRQTGHPFSRIFVDLLAAAGKSVPEILTELRAVNRAVEKALAEHLPAQGGSPPVRPLLLLHTSVDHNSAGTFYSLTPEAGIETRRVSLFAGLPYYRNAGTLTAGGGPGDAYFVALLRGGVSRYDVASSVSVGFPTGDASQGLGAGEVTFDAAGTVSRNLETVRPFLTVGFTNSVFANVGYLRPYVSNGAAAHVSGGLEFQVRHRLTFGVSGFALRPLGEQTVHSRMTGAADTPSGRTAMEEHMNPQSAHVTRQRPFYEYAQRSIVPAGQLHDHGAGVWASAALHRGVWLNLAVTRSQPFELTTVRFGLGFDLGRFLFPAKRL